MRSYSKMNTHIGNHLWLEPISCTICDMFGKFSKNQVWRLMWPQGSAWATLTTFLISMWRPECPRWARVPPRCACATTIVCRCHQKSIQINENHRKSMKIDGNQWKTMKINENQWTSIVFTDFPWHRMVELASASVSWRHMRSPRALQTWHTCEECCECWSYRFTWPEESPNSIFLKFTKHVTYGT